MEEVTVNILLDKELSKFDVDINKIRGIVELIDLETCESFRNFIKIPLDKVKDEVYNGKCSKEILYELQDSIIYYLGGRL